MYAEKFELESKIRNYYEAAEYAENNGDYEGATYYLQEAQKLWKEIEKIKDKQNSMRTRSFSDYCEAELMLC